eukprot:5186237-Pleurochrysis_carterae.AAC.1
MRPPYHCPFLNPPSQGDSHSTRLPCFDPINLRIYLDQNCPLERVCLFSSTRWKILLLEVQRSVARNATMWAFNPIRARKLGGSAQGYHPSTFDAVVV